MKLVIYVVKIMILFIKFTEAKSNTKDYENINNEMCERSSATSLSSKVQCIDMDDYSNDPLLLYM